MIDLDKNGRTKERTDRRRSERTIDFRICFSCKLQITHLLASEATRGRILDDEIHFDIANLRETLESCMGETMREARRRYWHQRRIAFRKYALSAFFSCDTKSSSSVAILFKFCLHTYLIYSGKRIFYLSLQLALCIPSGKSRLIPTSVAKECSQGTIHPSSCFASTTPSILQVSLLLIPTYLILSC